MVEGNKEKQKISSFFFPQDAEKGSQILCARISSEIRSVHMAGDWSHPFLELRHSSAYFKRNQIKSN